MSTDAVVPAQDTTWLSPENGAIPPETPFVSAAEGHEASYLALYRSGELKTRVERLVARLQSCDICPHDCFVDRLADKVAKCATGRLAFVGSVTPHFGEEPAVAGPKGSGTIFLVNCNLKCRFCQNWQISQRPKDERHRLMTPAQLGQCMLDLQDKGCHNVNFVSPTHVVPQIMEGLLWAVERGFHLPLVYNTNAYDAVSTLRELDGVVDVWLPDLKWMSDQAGKDYSGIPRYPHFAKAAIAEMARQCPRWIEDPATGLVRRGVIIRHLVMPNDVADTEDALAFVASLVAGGADVRLSLMGQYFPTHHALKTPLIDRPLRPAEYARALKAAGKLGLDNGWMQELRAQEYYRPNFDDRGKPFADIDDFMGGRKTDGGPGASTGKQDGTKGAGNGSDEAAAAGGSGGTGGSEAQPEVGVDTEYGRVRA